MMSNVTEEASRAGVGLVAEAMHAAGDSARGRGDRRAVRGEAIEGGLDRLNRALGVAVRRHDGSGLGMHVPLAGAFAARGARGFRGIVRAPSDVVHTLVTVDECFAGTSFRLGIGVGPLPRTVRRQRENDCLALAEGALAEARRAKRWARASGFGEAGDHVLNGVLALVGALRSEWTEKQARTVRLARGHPTRRAVAAELAVSPSVVTEALAAARFDVLEEAESALGRLFGLFDPMGAKVGL